MNIEKLNHNRPAIPKTSSRRSISSVDYQKLNKINNITLKCDAKIRNTIICNVLKKSERRRSSFPSNSSSHHLGKNYDGIVCSSIGYESLESKAFQDSLTKQGMLQFDNGWIELMVAQQQNKSFQSFDDPIATYFGQVTQNKKKLSIDPRWGVV